MQNGIANTVRLLALLPISKSNESARPRSRYAFSTALDCSLNNISIIEST